MIFLFNFFYHTSSHFRLFMSLLTLPAALPLLVSVSQNQENLKP